MGVSNNLNMETHRLRRLVVILATLLTLRLSNFEEKTDCPQPSLALYEQVKDPYSCWTN